MAENQTTVDVHRVRGRLFEIDVAVPSGLQLISVGPPDLVESSTLLGKEAQAAANARAGPAGQIVRVSLTTLGRDQRSFSLNLVGHQRIGPGEEVNLGLFSVLGCVSTRNVYQVFTARAITFEAGDDGNGPGGPEAQVFRPQPLDQRAPASAAKGGPLPALVLESNDSPVSLRGRLRRHRLAIDHESRISALVSRRRVDVRQETSLQVRYGAVSSLVVQVPFPETDAWEVQARETVRREDLGQSGGGTARRRYRLTFDPPISDRTSLQFKFELPLGQVAGDAAEVRSTIPWILLEEGSSRLHIGRTQDGTGDQDVGERYGLGRGRRGTARPTD